MEDLGAVYTWRGIRFYKKHPQYDEVLRYESDDMGFIGALLTRNKVGQWSALFRVGVYSIEWTPEKALREAAIKAADFHRYDAARFDAIVAGYRASTSAFEGLYDAWEGD